QLPRVRPRPLFGVLQRREALQPSLEAQGDVLRLGVARLQMAQGNNLLVLAVRREDERVIAAKLQFARFPERSQVQSLRGVGRTAIAVLRSPDSRDDNDCGPRVGKLA